MFFWNKICGIIAIFLFLNTGLSAQNLTADNSDQNFIQTKQYNLPDSFHYSFSILKKENIYPTSIPPNFSTCNFGFFCKKELQIEKATKLPIHLRLGSLEQCNYYEGKN